MNAPNTRDSGDTSAEPRPVRPVRRVGQRFVDLFPQLFLIPLLLVTIGVLVYFFFHASAHDTRGISEIVRDMQSAGEHARDQDAFLLVQRIRDEEAKLGGRRTECLSEEDARLLVRLLDKFPDENLMREYVIKSLGRAGPLETTLPVLIRVLAASEDDRSEKHAALTALGLTRSPEAVPPVVAELEKSRGEDDWQTRLFASHALVNIAGERDDIDTGPIVALLRRQLADPQREVAWNTAYWLARYFGDASGIRILRRLSDVGFLDRQTGDGGRDFTDQEKRDWVFLAIEGLHSLDREAILGRLEDIRRIAKDRRWPEVVNRVNEYLTEAEAAEAAEARDET